MEKLVEISKKLIYGHRVAAISFMFFETKIDFDLASLEVTGSRGGYSYQVLPIQFDGMLELGKVKEITLIYGSGYQEVISIEKYMEMIS